MGSGETDAVSEIAGIARELQDKYPQIRYHIYSGDASHIMERLDKGLLDFGLLVRPADITKYDYLDLPDKDTWGVLMRQDSPLSDKEYICADDLQDLPLIVSRQASSKDIPFSWLHMDANKLNIVATYDLIYNASRFVKQGVGYAIALDKIINTSGDSELCFRPLFPTSESGLCIVWKKYQVFSRAATAFLQQLKSEFETV